MFVLRRKSIPYDPPSSYRGEVPQPKKFINMEKQYRVCLLTPTFRNHLFLACKLVPHYALSCYGQIVGEASYLMVFPLLFS